VSVATALCDGSALLLLASGPAKLRHPAATVAMLSELHLPGVPKRALPGSTRLIGLAEIAIAGYVLVIGDRLSAVLLAAAYLSFALVGVRLLVSDSAVDCGCFGAASEPISRAHVVVTTACLASAIAGIIAPVGAVSALFSPDAVLGAVTAGLVVVLAGAAYLTITALPALMRARLS
jgi:hypothetical protein